MGAVSTEPARPCGDVVLRSNDTTRGPNNELVIYAVCRCGRGYAWPGATVTQEQFDAWCDNHDVDTGTMKGLAFNGDITICDATTKTIDGDPPTHFISVTFTEGM
jgi:hypothetical protein